MIRALSNWLFRQALLERSQRHAHGYRWAMDVLHRGEDPSPLRLHADQRNPYFEIGIADAVVDFDKIDADKMWLLAANREDDDPLERTQPLDRITPVLFVGWECPYCAQRLSETWLQCPRCKTLKPNARTP